MFFILRNEEDGQPDRNHAVRIKKARLRLPPLRALRDVTLGMCAHHNTDVRRELKGGTWKQDPETWHDCPKMLRNVVRGFGCAAVGAGRRAGADG